MFQSQAFRVVAEAWVQLQMKKKSITIFQRFHPNYSGKEENLDVEYPLCSTAMTPE